MDDNEIGPLDEFTEHVKGIAFTIRQAKEASRICSNGNPVRFQLSAGNTSLDFVLRHGEHRVLISDGFDKLVKHLEKSLRKLDVDYTQL